MTATLLGMLILVAGEIAPAENRYPAAIQVFHCDFGESWDANYDLWPEGWSRKRGPRFPLFLDADIEDDSTLSSARRLTFKLDGSGVAAFSPPITVGPLFSYVLEAKLKTEGLVHDRAFLSVTFYDASRKPFETFYSDRIGKADAWTKLRVGPIASKNESVAYAAIGLHLEPTEQEDLTGSASFADVWLGRVPRMTVTADSACSVYLAGVQPTICCKVSGVEDREPSVRFELLDVYGNSILQVDEKLAGKMTQVALATPNESGTPPATAQIAAPTASHQPEPLDTAAGAVSSKKLRSPRLIIGPGSRISRLAEVQPGRVGEKAPQIPKTSADEGSNFEVFVGEANWSPKIPDVGFYWVRVTMQGGTGVVHQRRVPVALVRKEETHVSGEFGWTLPRAERPLSFAALLEIISHAGIHSLKFPVWCGASESSRLDRLVWFAERLQSLGIELVGLLDQPPPEVVEKFGAGELLSPARVFSAEPDVWYPSLEPIVTRLSLNLSCWQLGGDHDYSFIGYPGAERHVNEVKTHFERFGQKAKLGIGWNWLQELPLSGDVPWSFFSLSAEPALTAAELGSYLASKPSEFRGAWITLQSLPAETYSIDDRARDLVFRMLTAKIHGADKVIFSDPINSSTGLLSDDGRAGEMLLPWRTMAMGLAGSEHLGSMPLPQGSTNEVFIRDGKATMIVWSAKPTSETIFLGNGVEQIDLWGRRKGKPATDQAVLQVSPVPTLVTGIDEALMRWHMACDLTVRKVPSVFGKPHPNSLKVQNFFRQGISGKARLMTPDVWRTTPREINFRLAAGEASELPFEITLPYDASSGAQTIRIDFDISADRRYQFSIYRPFDIGLGEVSVDILTRVNEQGQLEVTQQLRNQTDGPISFRCQLFAPGRHAMRSQVLNHERGVDTKVYRLDRGSELVGQTLWLRAEEIGGSRSLNYRFVAQE